MVLKEAFRNQNFLDGLIEKAGRYLTMADNITTKKQEHLRHAANPDAEDEVLVVPKMNDVNYTPNDVVRFVMDVLSEKEILTAAITLAKSETDIDIDSALAMNKIKQRTAQMFNYMNDFKASENKTTAIGKKFNINGEQVNYSYEMNQVVSIDFDRNVTRSLYKKLTKETDEVSTKIDQLNVTLNVNYEPVYDLSDSFDDCIETFLAK